MKVYTKVIIDMATMEVEEEESFEYSGSVAMCGGGGASGEIDYPDYMKDQHYAWLNAGQGTTYNPGMAYFMQRAIDRNPHRSDYVFNPLNEINNMWMHGNTLSPLINAMGVNTEYREVVSYAKKILDDTLQNEDNIANVINAFAGRYDTELEATTYPRFEAGMRDINAVQSSAFAIGRSNIENTRNTAVAAFDAETRMKVKFDYAQSGLGMVLDAHKVEMQALNMKLEYTKILSNILVDTGRIVIVAEKEYHDGMIEERDARQKWPLDVFMYGGNLLASIGSASVQTGIKKNKAASAIGGGLSGAAAGASIGSSMASGASAGSSAGPYGAVIGGVLGVAAGLLSSN